MSFKQNKTNVLCVTILIFTVAMACAISVSAQSTIQSTAAANGLTAKQNSTRDLGESSTEKKSVRLAEGSDLTPGPATVSEVKVGFAVSDSATHRSDTNAAPAGPQAGSADKWQFQVTPYLWLAGLHGTAGVGARSTQVDESFSDVFHSLDFAIMGTFEAHKGKLVLLTDLEYVAVSDDKATPGPLFSNVEAKFKTFVFDPEVGYRLIDKPDKGSSVDLLVGMRVWHVSTDLNFGAGILPAVEAQGSRNWVDAVVGMRGKAALSKKLFLTGKFDLGGGGSKFTYQVFGGAGYNVKDSIALIFGYRILEVNYNKNNFLFDMTERGPILGVGFRF